MTLAFWNLELNTQCPDCNYHFDILDIESDFWELNIKPLEHDTENTKSIEVSCPNCLKDFYVKLTY